MLVNILKTRVMNHKMERKRNKRKDKYCNQFFIIINLSEVNHKRNKMLISMIILKSLHCKLVVF